MIVEDIKAGTATYRDAEIFAWEIGNDLSQAFRLYISPDILPDGRMYRDMAESVIRPMLEEDYALVADAVSRIQETLNRNAGIGLKAQVAEMNENRIRGIIEKVSGSEQFGDVSWMLDAPIRNFSVNVVDRCLQSNAEFQYSAGMKPRIIRRAEPKCCPWCDMLAGEYDYPDCPHDVFRRHNNCRCVVEYDPGDGRRQNVHTKKWTDPQEDAKINTRKSFALLSGNRRRYESDIVIDRSVGAQAKNYTVLDLETGEFFRFAGGTRIQNVEVFAGKGTKKEFRKAQKYADRYGGSPENWQHAKGHGVVETQDGNRKAEVHWVQCEGIGKFDFFVKRWEA